MVLGLLEGGGGTGASTFVELTDTPAALGTKGQIPAVNEDENALIFVDPPSGTGGTSKLQFLLA